MLILYLLLSVALIVLLTARWKTHPFIALLLVALAFGFAAGLPLSEIIASINGGFGDTMGKIGLLIVLGTIIGAFLENSGGAFALAEKVLGLVGRKRVSPAMGFIGYLVSIPVFADSGFILLSPLCKSLAKKAGITLAGAATALALGLLASHTMVPPTPGPVAAAGILGADVGLVLALGIPVSAISLLAGLFFVRRYAERTWLDPNPDLDDAAIQRRLREAPRAGLACLPIVVPIALIVMKSLLFSGGNVSGGWKEAAGFVGEPVVALLIGMFLSFLLPKKFDKEMLSATGWAGKAMVSAASILLITGAGGIFGKILQNAGITDVLGGAIANSHLGLWLPFLLAAAIKTAQGSSTVALITAASIMSPLMAAAGFETDTAKALVVLAMGAGSSVVSHANDSFFWVATQMSGMDVKTGYRLVSLGTLVQGTTAAVVLFLMGVVGQWLMVNGQ